MSLPNSTPQTPRADRDSGVRFQNAETIKLIYKPVARRVAHQVLVDKNRSRSQPEKGRFGHFEVERLFLEVWDICCSLTPNESHCPADRCGMKMRMTCLTIAFFEVLSAAGIERGYAAELISEISWRTYDKWRLFSGMNKPAEAAPQNDSGRPIALPVPYHFPGGYRQVDSIPRNSIAHTPGSAR